MIDRPLRVEGFLEAAELSDPDMGLLGVAADDYAGPVVVQSRTLSLKPGEALPDLLPEGAAGGFLLDLDPPDWRSEWGGLLLFQGEREPLHGYRPVPGALTLFHAVHAPLISLITPQGRTRTSILGWWF